MTGGRGTVAWVTNENVYLVGREMIRSRRKREENRGKKKKERRRKGNFQFRCFPSSFFTFLRVPPRAARIVSWHRLAVIPFFFVPSLIILLLRRALRARLPSPLPFWFQARMLVCSVVRVGVCRARANAAHPRDYTMCREYGDEYIALCVLVRCVRSSVEYIYAR